MKYINDLARDIAIKDFSDVVARHKSKVPSGTKIADVVASMEKQSLLESLIRDDWKNDGTDKNGLYLLKTASGYEVFTGERGIKNWLETFADLKSACSSLVDLVLNELLHEAPNSKIR